MPGIRSNLRRVIYEFRFGLENEIKGGGYSMKAAATQHALNFRNSISWSTARRGTMTNTEHQPVEIGSPPEFKGTPDVWCPEELFIGAVNTCLMLTFLSLAGRRQIGISAYESDAEGTVENRAGRYRITRIKVRPVVSLNQVDVATAQEVFKDAKEACIISNSVIAQVDLVPRFKVLPPVRP
jgi:organic hydroperoxide reductase OsmC/OhrA